jgi:ribosome-binding protein aMBF1 (putative translation factor)
MSEERIVEAIEDGRIVRVTESYARKEDLPILRRSAMQELQKSVNELAPGTPERIKKEIEIKKDQDWREQQVISELVDNFNWIIRVERRKKGITRRQFAKILNVPDAHIRMIEEGRLPASDFVLINQIQKTLGINLRKDEKEFDIPLKDIVPSDKQKTGEKESLTGSDIEILEGEI